MNKSGVMDAFELSESEEMFWKSIERIFDELLRKALEKYGPRA